jgi:hypothetical protein
MTTNTRVGNFVEVVGTGYLFRHIRWLQGRVRRDVRKAVEDKIQYLSI